MLESFSIDGLELLDTDDFWLEEGVDGLDEPDRRIATAENPGADGGFVASTLYGMRPVSVPGILKGRGPLGMAAARSALGQACQLKRDVSGVRQLKTINFRFDGRDYTFQGEVTRFKAPNVGTGAVEFLIGIIAEDPLLYDPDEQDTGNIVRATGGGLIVPFVSPAVAAASSGGQGIATNDGNSDAPVILELVGPLTSPYVLNQATGKFFQLGYEIPEGTTVLVDTRDNSVLIDGGGSLIGSLVAGSSFLKLVPGENDFIFSTGDSSNTGHLKVRWRNASISL